MQQRKTNLPLLLMYADRHQKEDCLEPALYCLNQAMSYALYTMGLGITDPQVRRINGMKQALHRRLRTNNR